MGNEYQLALIEGVTEGQEPSTEHTLVEREYTVQEVFGIPSQMKIKGCEPGHPLVPQKTPGFVWDKKLVRDVIEWLSEDNPDPVMMTGPTGCGKTDFWKNIFAGLNFPAIIISAKSSTEPDDLIGKTELRNGNTVFVMGELLRFYSRGYPLIFDEVDSYPPEVGMACHRLFERNTVILDNGAIIQPAARNLIVATANTRGDGQGNDLYSGAQVMNLATMNRFEKWKMSYPDPEDEIMILKNKFGTSLEDSVIQAMVKTANDIRTAFMQGSCPGPISVRDLLRWGRKLVAAWSRKDVIPLYHSFDKAFGNGVDEYVQAMLHTLVQTNFNVPAPQIKGVNGP